MNREQRRRAKRQGLGKRMVASEKGRRLLDGEPSKSTEHPIPEWIFNLAGGRTLLAWDRIATMELQSD